MLWIFVVIGLLTSGSVLYRLMAASERRRRSWLLLMTPLLLLIVAWVAQHTTVVGWLALLIAFGLESAHWAAGRFLHKTSTATALPAVTVPAAPPAPPSEAAEPAVEEPASETEVAIPTRSFTTVALLREPWKPSAGVFLASLRRTGQRDAGLHVDASVVHSQDHVRVQVGDMLLELAAFRSSVTRSQIDYAASQAWDWPQAAERVAGHAAHVTLTSTHGEQTPPPRVVKLHHRAHAALAEFAAVIAVLWPDAGRLVPVEALSGLCDSAEDAAPTRCCVNFRVFPLEDEEAGHFVADTVGLHAFGLPDLQIVTDREPDDAVSAVLYDQAERFFQAGCELEEGQELRHPPAVRWRVRKASSRFPPDRRVIELQQIPR